MSNLFSISADQIKSALVSGILTAILAGFTYIIGLGDVFAIDVHSLINVIALSFGVTIISLIKSFFTTSEGKFVGSVKIAPVSD